MLPSNRCSVHQVGAKVVSTWWQRVVRTLGLQWWVTLNGCPPFFFLFALSSSMGVFGFGVCEGCVCVRCGMDLRARTLNFNATVWMHQEGCCRSLKQRKELCSICKFSAALFVF